MKRDQLLFIQNNLAFALAIEARLCRIFAGQADEGHKTGP
jgi:hypothetical protein